MRIPPSTKQKLATDPGTLCDNEWRIVLQILGHRIDDVTVVTSSEPEGLRVTLVWSDGDRWNCSAKQAYDALTTTLVCQNAGASW